MKPKYNITMIKNIGQFGVAPLLGLILTIVAVRGGGLSGYFAMIFGGLILVAMTTVILVIYDRLIVQRCIRLNEQEEKEYRENIRRSMQDNIPDDGIDD